MGKEQRNAGKSQPKTQNTASTSRNNRKQISSRKGSNSQRQKPAHRKPSEPILVKTNKDLKPDENPLPVNQNTSTISLKPPTYERSLHIKIPANFKKKNPSIDIPDIQSLRKQKADRIIEALKALEQTLDQFQYPAGNLPGEKVKDLVMEIEAFEK